MIPSSVVPRRCVLRGETLETVQLFTMNAVPLPLTGKCSPSHVCTATAAIFFLYVVYFLLKYTVVATPTLPCPKNRTIRRTRFILCAFHTHFFISCFIFSFPSFMILFPIIIYYLPTPTAPPPPETRASQEVTSRPSWSRPSCRACAAPRP